LTSRVSIGILVYHFGWLSINEVVKEDDVKDAQ
jgi:hypothetical protein